jgi:hypothetical protein
MPLCGPPAKDSTGSTIRNRFKWLGFFLNGNMEGTLYIKEDKENTATRNIEKNYFRVDKKTTS